MPALGGGFAISDKSVSALGQGFAGAAALGEDASALYNNPALLTSLKGSQLAVAIHIIDTHGEYRDQGSNTSGDTREDVHRRSYLPNLYYVTDLGNNLHAGVGVYSPFGLGLEYDENWRGRYHTIESSLRTINVSPTLAWQASEQLSLGGTLNIQYADARLKQAVDFGILCVARLMGLGADQTTALTNCAALGLVPQGSDGYQMLTGDSLSYGPSLGLALQSKSGRSRAGLVWHGPVTHTLKGNSKFENVPAMLATTFSDSQGQVSITLPESVSLSAAHAATERLTLLADYTWTRWSSFDELRVKFSNSLPDSVAVQGWNDSARYSIGLNYRLTPAWLLRAGYVIDETPVPNANLRSPRVPDADRRWYTIGFRWALSEDFSIDAAYAYAPADNAPIDNTDSLGHNLKGEYTDILGQYLSVQGNWHF